LAKEVDISKTDIYDLSNQILFVGFKSILIAEASLKIFKLVKKYLMRNN